MDEPVKPPTVKRAGDPRGGEATWTLINSVPEGCCSQCATEHEPELPHNQQSLYYQHAFHAEHNRWPSWTDAMAHCTEEIKRRWTEALVGHGVQI